MRSWMIPWTLAVPIGISSFLCPSAESQAQQTSQFTNYSSNRATNAVLIAPALEALPNDEDSEEPAATKVQSQSSPSDQTEGEKTSGGSDVMAPVLNRQLTIKVQAVSTSHEKVGTGLVPTASRPQWTDEAGAGAHRDTLYTHVHWQASMIQHHPLYFEDAMLERHGHTRCCRGWEVSQSVVSGAKFFGTIAFLPYLRTLQPKHQCVYALGHYRAGSGAPCLRSNLPYDGRAAIVESASVAAFFWAAPL